MTALDTLLLVALPYAALALCVAGVIWRRRRARFTISALSSQFLESRWVARGAVSLHLGLAVLLLGHLAPLLLPGPWHALVARRAVLLAMETIGMAAALLAAAGLLMLLGRRLVHGAVRAVTTPVDLVVVLLLLVQVGLGLATALRLRWGAIWAVGITTPYLWSLLCLRPDAALASGLPLLAKLHLAGAWLVLALVPFTRLIHLFSWPLGYLWRPRQRVLWSTRRTQSPRASA